MSREIAVATSLAGGDDRAHVEARHQGDVVQDDDVRRIDHRDEHRAIVEHLHRQALVALGCCRVDEVRGREVDLEEVEVDEVDAVALGDGASQSLRRQRTLLDEHRLDGPARLVRLLLGGVHLLGGEHAEHDGGLGVVAGRASQAARTRHAIGDVVVVLVVGVLGVGVGRGLGRLGRELDRCGGGVEVGGGRRLLDRRDLSSCGGLHGSMPAAWACAAWCAAS